LGLIIGRKNGLLGHHTMELVGMLIRIEYRLLEVWLLWLINILEFKLNRLTDWNSSGVLLFLLEILIILLILHSKINYYIIKTFIYIFIR